METPDNATLAPWLAPIFHLHPRCIAGGREVYSQSRSRPGRHGKGAAAGAGTSSSGAAAAAAAARRSQHVAHRQQELELPQQEQQQHVVRETVFSSEIYEQTTSKPRQETETDIVDCGDDVNVTYADIMEGAAVADSGLVVKSCVVGGGGKGSSDPDTVSLNSSSCHSSADLSSLGSKNVIGSVTIAEYEGSPRRYRPRKSDEGAAPAAAGTKKSSSGGARRRIAPGGAGSSPGKVPGFPQRVIPAPKEVAPAVATTATAASSPPSSPSSTSSSVTQKRKQQSTEAEAPTPAAATAVAEVAAVSHEVLVKFDEALQEKGGEASEEGVEYEDPTARQKLREAARSSGGGGKDGGYDYQYEFSETRKVLDEFFPAGKSAVAAESTAKCVAAPEDNFMDLNYTLTRRSANSGSSASSSRPNGGALANHLSHHQHVQPQPEPQPPPLAEPDLLQLQHPQVGLSPLDHAPPSMMVGKAAAASSSSDVTISTASSVATTGGRSNGTDTGYATLNSPDSVRHNAVATAVPATPHQQQQSQPPLKAAFAPQRAAHHVEFSQVNSIRIPETPGIHTARHH